MSLLTKGDGSGQASDSSTHNEHLEGLNGIIRVRRGGHGDSKDEDKMVTVVATNTISRTLPITRQQYL